MKFPITEKIIFLLRYLNRKNIYVNFYQQISVFNHKKSHNNQHFFQNLKGTGTQDLIWLKVVSLDRSWLVGLTDDL